MTSTLFSYRKTLGCDKGAPLERTSWPQPPYACTCAREYCRKVLLIIIVIIIIIIIIFMIVVMLEYCRKVRTNWSVVCVKALGGRH